MHSTQATCGLTAFVLGWVAALSAFAYPVAPAISLDELAGQADLVCKVEVLGSKPVEDEWFDKAHGFLPHETEMKIIAVYQGKCPYERIFFHHYAPGGQGRAPGYMPQSYEFEPGRSYIVFAKETASERVYRQIAKSHRSMEDQGVVLAATKESHAGESVKEVIWRELTGHLQSKADKDVLYGLSHLDTLSGGGYEKLKDFDRREALDALLPLLNHASQDVVQKAIRAIGSRNPYLSPDYAPSWLASIGEGNIHGFGTWDRTKLNLGGQTHWKKLAEIADSQAPAATRSLAIKALGRAEVPQLLEHLEKWAKSDEPAVRQSAIMLLADFPQKADRRLIEVAAGDEQAIVRAAAAQAIGFGQFHEQMPLLGMLIDDKDPDVARFAAMSLLSFSLKSNHGILERHTNHAEFSPLFINALASQEPQKYVDQLAEIIRTQRAPNNWWGGRVPWGVSWDALFRYAQQQPPDKLKDAEFDKVLEALEYPSLGTEMGPAFYSSSEPRDLYALYVQRGLTKRAQSFRAACKKALTYDIDYYFKMVDENPGQYQRQ
jgi:HEAT repeat protein